MSRKPAFVMAGQIGELEGKLDCQRQPMADRITPMFPLTSDGAARKINGCAEARVSEWNL